MCSLFAHQVSKTSLQYDFSGRQIQGNAYGITFSSISNLCLTTRPDRFNLPSIATSFSNHTVDLSLSDLMLRFSHQYDRILIYTMDLSYLISPMILFSICIYCSLLHKANILPHLSKINHRYDYIDGLRGLAAILVVCSHSWRFRDIGFINNEVTKADYFYIGNFGALGVQLFFCITGFLFFKKILKNGLTIDWKAFYLSRIKRLAPLYFVFCICVFVIGISVAGVSSVNSQAITSAAKLLTFGFMGTTFSIGSYNSGYITPILWTLSYEWKFYIAIPMIAAFISTKKSSLIFIIISAAIYASLSAADNFNIWIFFLSGGLAAFLERYSSDKISFWMKPVFYLLSAFIVWSSFSHEIDKYGIFRALTTTLLSSALS